MSVLQDAEKVIKYISSLKTEGEKMITTKSEEVPPTIGIFISDVPEWEPDTKYVKGDVFIYQGNSGYVKQPSLTSQDLYPPFSVGTEALYGARPSPDADGVYPYVYNMGIYEGMLVRYNDIVYRSITGTWDNPTELLYKPSEVPSLLVPITQDTNDGEGDENPPLE